MRAECTSVCLSPSQTGSCWLVPSAIHVEQTDSWSWPNACGFVEMSVSTVKGSSCYNS